MSDVSGAHLVGSSPSQRFRCAPAIGVSNREPTLGIEVFLCPVKHQHNASILSGHDVRPPISSFLKTQGFRLAEVEAVVTVAIPKKIPFLVSDVEDRVHPAIGTDGDLRSITTLFFWRDLYGC